MNYLVFDIETTEPVGPGPLTDMDISVISVYNSQDKKMHSFLEKDFGKMWKMFEETDAIVGYNSDHFDIPILNKYYPGDLTQIKSIDMLVSIKESFGRRVKLDSIAEATLGTKKSGHGLQAVEWWKEGEIDKIIKYCEDDVWITKDVFEFALENGYLKLKDFNGETIKIPVDTSKWSEQEDSSMTHSMGF
jgi:DEAD/DEAH box helicase domain-containing protein